MKSAYVKVNCRKFKGQDPLPTLSMEDARQKVSQLLTDHLQLKVEGYAADTQTICDVLVKAPACRRQVGGRQGHRRDVQRPGGRPDGAYRADLPQRPTQACRSF